MVDIEVIEAQRLERQAALDEQKTQAERNKAGQFATPTRLARDVVSAGLAELNGAAVSFLDPAIGTGSFFSALLAVNKDHAIDVAVGFDIDDHYADPARELWSEHELELRTADFTVLVPTSRFNLIVCNPPYVRHHHLPKTVKTRLVQASSEIAGTRVSGLCGLYGHFLLLSKPWMDEGGIGVWLIPSEFMDVNYGKAIKRFLLNEVTLLRIHRADPASLEFDDALVSSAIVIFANRAPPPGHRVRFTYGGSLAQPATESLYTVLGLTRAPKWTRFPLEAEPIEDEGEARPLTLGDVFVVRRGIATGNNKFFIVTQERAAELGLPEQHLTPILPSPRNLKTNEVASRDDGVPDLDSVLMLIDCSRSQQEVQERHPRLWSYLEAGVGAVSERYLCSKRKPWYCQEQREPSPLMCTYMGRGDPAKRNPFRFIRNRSRAIGANVYLMLYPKVPAAADDAFVDRIWEHLNALDPRKLLREGRVYGGGLHKLEPAELSAVPIPVELLPAELAVRVEHAVSERRQVGLPFA